MSLLSIAIRTQADEEDFRSLHENARREVRFWLRMFDSVLARMDAGERIGTIIKKLSGKTSISETQIRRKWDAWRKNGDWRDLYNKSKYGNTGGGSLPGAFIEFWKSMQMTFQRETAGKAAWRALIRIWQEGQHIPGYAVRPEADPATGIPEGWSYANLMRKEHLLTAYEAKAIQIGKSAASHLIPSVISTRVGLLPGQIIMCDDQDYDVQVGFVGINRKLTRPSGFNALDLLSGCDILQGFKPTVLNADGSKQKLRQTDYEWFIVNLLTTVGYRKDTGTKIIGESGTAKGSTDFEDRVIMATNGKVEFDSSRIHSAPSIAGLFKGQPRGNPRFKAARESWFRLLREEMAALPAPTGRNRDSAPEGNHGLEQYSRYLLDAATALPPERRGLLQHPGLLWHEFVDLALSITQQINMRTDHDLEGWQKLKFVAKEWRFDQDSPWLSMDRYLAMPPAKRMLVDELIAQDPLLFQTRYLSPWEVWVPGREQLSRVKGPQIPVLLGQAHARIERVERDLTILIDDQDIYPETMEFAAVLTSGRTLDRGQEYAVFLNPYLPEEIQVCDKDLRWIGTAARRYRDCRIDVEALRHQFNEVAKIEKQQLVPIARMGAKITREAIARAEHNTNVLTGAPTASDASAARKFARENKPTEADVAAVFDTSDLRPAANPEGEMSPEEISALFRET